MVQVPAFDRNALQSLIDCKVWIAAPKSFNDPFDCAFYIDREHSDQELLEHLNDCAESRGETRRFTLEDIPQERLHFERALASLEEGCETLGSFAWLPHLSTRLCELITLMGIVVFASSTSEGRTMILVHQTVSRSYTSIQHCRSAGRRDGDLLAEDGAHGKLEAVPGARHAEAGRRAAP